MTGVRADPKLLVEPALHLALQRGREEVEVEGKSHLACRREEDGGRVVVPPFPAQAGRRASWRSVHWSAMVVDAAHLGSPGVAFEHACDIYFSEPPVLAVLERGHAILYSPAGR